MMSVFKIRSIYLLMYMAFAVWRVFYNIYLEDAGLKGSEIGTLNAIMQSTIFLVVAFWGVYADKKGIRLTLRIGVIGTALTIFALAYITNFWLLLLYLPFLTFFYHPLGALTDALGMQFSAAEKTHSYGSFRLWGSLGWALAAIVGGFLFSHISIKYIFPISSGLFILLIPFLSTRRKKRTFTANFETISIRELLKNKSLLFFVGVISLYGAVCSPINSYLNLYFTELESGNSTVGLAYAIMAFSELPLFLIGNSLLKKFGARIVILIGMVTMVFRYVVYGFFADINLALVVGALQGVSLAFFLVGAVDYMKRLIPAGQHATAQSILWGSYSGLGQTVGNLLIGFLIDRTGMVGVMQLWGGVAISCVILTFVYFRMNKSVLNE